MKKHIPNLITLGNLIFGCLAIVSVLSHNYSFAVICLICGFVCDYADGMVARVLGVSSPLGKELDSLADVISFGVVPGVFLYTVLSAQFCPSAGVHDIQYATPLCGKSILAFIFSGCAALRLGKFNLDTRQSTYFLGLSTPAATIFVTGLCMAILNDEPIAQYFNQPWLILVIMLALCAMMLSEVKLLGLKINPKVFSANLPALVSILAGLALIYTFGYSGACLSILLYVLGSVIYFAQQKAY
jgi:CDP-diacylglycerol---serine O-phosphatidyltransferase